MSDDFETDSLATKTNATYVSADKLYSNSLVTPIDITSGLSYGATTGASASNAFDDNASTYWQANAANTVQHCYVDFGAGNNKNIRYCSIKISGSSDGNRTPGTAAQGTGLYYSSDGTNWTLLQGLSIVDSIYVQEFTITAPSPGAYRYWSIGQYNLTQDVRAYEIQMSESPGIVNTAGSWTGKTVNWAIYSSGVEKITSAASGLQSNVVVSGDFEFQATLQSTSALGSSELVIGCFAASELATFDDSPAGLNTGCAMNAMTNSFWGLWSQNAVYYGSASQATVTGANNDVMKITRVGSTIKFYKNGTLAHTWTQTYSGDVYLVLAAHNNWQGWYSISLPASISAGALPFLDSGQTPTTATNAGLTQIDRSWKVANDRTITHMAIYETSAITVVLKVLKRDGAGAFTTVVNKSYSHSGDGWEVVALDSPYTVPSSGDYHVGAYSASNFCCGPASTEPVSYKTGDQTGTWTGATDNNSNGYCALVRVYYQSTAGVANITLIPSSSTLASEPNDAAVYVLKENVDNVTEGADFKVFTSIDGGTTWTEASLTAVGNFGSTDKLIRAEADVSGQSGTSFKWKITTHNAKSQRIKQVTAYCG
jgi:hypothetical protein